ALLMVMDQQHLLYHSPVRASLTPDNNACIMLLARRATPGLTYLGYRRLVLTSPSSVAHTCLAIMASLSLKTHTTTIITADPLITSLSLPADTVTADRHLVCAAPFAALSDMVAPNRDYLLLTRDGPAVCGVAFRPLEA